MEMWLTIPHNFSKNENSCFPAGCADAAAENGRRHLGTWTQRISLISQEKSWYVLIIRISSGPPEELILNQGNLSEILIRLGYPQWISIVILRISNLSIHVLTYPRSGLLILFQRMIYSQGYPNLSLQSLISRLMRTYSYLSNLKPGKTFPIYP